MHEEKINEGEKKRDALVIAGPSGVGKTTLVNKLMKDFPDKFGFSISHTTRAPRNNEIEGKDYHFLSKEDFADLRNKGEFMETVEYSGNFYGTSFESVRSVTNEGKICLFILTVEGVEKMKRLGLNAIYVFVTPPSLEEARRRLASRGDISEELITRRLKEAELEMEYMGKENFWDCVILNDVLEDAYLDLKHVLRTRDCLPPPNHVMDDFL